MASSSSKKAVQILEVTRVTPFSDSPISAAEFTVPLTFYDTYWFRFHPVERLFFYRLNNPDDSSPPLFNSAVLPRLKHSLAVTLLHYLPLAGHIFWPSNATEPVLLYIPDDGVSFTVAVDINDDFDRLAGGGPKRSLELHPFVPKLKSDGDTAEPLSLQITLFPGWGFCIGVTSHHAVLDGKTTASFMKSWSYICRKSNVNGKDFVLLPENSTPVFERSLIKDPGGLSGLYAKLWMESTGSSSDDPDKLEPIHDLGYDPAELVRVTYVLSNENIKILKNRVSPKLDEAKRRRVSSFAAAFGYIVSCLAGARGGGDGERVVGFGFTADYRGRLDPPLPESYFGNCVGSLGSYAKADELAAGENGVVLAVEKTVDLIMSLDHKLDDGSEDTLTPLLRFIERRRPGDMREMQIVSVAGSPRFGVYGSDFGWGQPEKVEVVSIDRSGAVSMAENRDEATGGIEVGVALKKDELQRFASLFHRGLNGP